MKIALSALVAEALKEMALPDDANAPIFKTWAYEAMREIGPSEIHIKGQEGEWLPVHDLKLQKPCDLLAPIRIELSKDRCTAIMPHFNPEAMQCDLCENCNCSCDIVGGEMDDHYFFGSNASEYIYGRILYVSIPVDKDNSPLIDERAARAVKQYIAFMETKRQRRRYRGTDLAPPQSEVEAEYERWKLMRREAMGEIKMPTIWQADGIARAWMHSGVTPATFINRWAYLYNAW